MSPSPTGRVSVVIPAYNAARYVGDAVRSVFAQEPAPYEVIVVDNNCTDDTVAVARRAGPVRIVPCAVKGPSAARNAGLDAAGGDYLQFLDADDVLLPGKLRHQAEQLARVEADVVYGPFRRVRIADDGTFVGPVFTLRPQLDPDDVILSLLGPDGFVQLACAMFRLTPRLRAVRFDESFSGIEDQRWLIDVAAAGLKFASDGGDVGFTMREHDTPGRVSAVGDVRFHAMVADNASRALAVWVRRGLPVDRRRVDAVATAWLRTATTFAVNGDPRWPALLASLRELDPSFARRLSRSRRALSRLVGFSRAAKVVDGFARARATAARRIKRVR